MPDVIELKERALPESCYVFKHSTRCPISLRAAQVVRSASLELPLYWVNVVEQRSLSAWVSRHFDVQHESPQLLQISEGQVVQHWSHGAITPELFE